MRSCQLDRRNAEEDQLNGLDSAAIEDAVHLFGRRLKKARTERGFTRVQLAGYTNLSLTSLENYEYGHHRPSFEAILALSQVLLVSPNYFFGCCEFSSKCDFGALGG
jgi:DNA-binding transcriptional regulator YiaG